MAHRVEGKYASLGTKAGWSVLFLVIFLLGRNLPLPLMHVASTAGAAGGSGATDGLNQAVNVATGGNFFQPTLFSLGLGPYMAANILWRLFAIDRFIRGRNIPQRTESVLRYSVMAVIAVFQAINLSGNFEIDSVNFGPFAPHTTGKIIAVAMLLAGAALLTWIANVNQDRGLGGITIFILYQILLTAVSNRDSFLQNLHSPDAARVLIPVGVACLIVIAMGVFLGNSEYRMKVNKVSIDNGFTGQSYLPIKLNPAGASPIMYAMALLSLPQTIIGAFAIIIPSFAPTAHSLLNNWGLSTLPGFLTYLVLLFAMSVFWGLMNVRPHKLAEQMQDAGEYLDSVAPGKETRRHIRNRVLVLASLTGVGLIVLTGLPLYFMAGNPQFQYELMMPGTLMILIALMWVVYEEIADTAIGRKYRFELLSTTGGAK